MSFISVIFFCNLEYLHILNIVDLDRLHLVDHCVLSFQNRPWHCVRVRIQMPNEWPYAVSLVPFTTSNVVSHPHNCSFFPILHHLNQLHFHPFSIYFPIIGPAFWYVHLILLSSLRLAFFTSWWQTFFLVFIPSSRANRRATRGCHSPFPFQRPLFVCFPTHRYHVW